MSNIHNKRLSTEFVHIKNNKTIEFHLNGQELLDSWLEKWYSTIQRSFLHNMSDEPASETNPIWHWFLKRFSMKMNAILSRDQSNDLTS